MLALLAVLPAVHLLSIACLDTLTRLPFLKVRGLGLGGSDANYGSRASVARCAQAGDMRVCGTRAVATRVLTTKAIAWAAVSRGRSVDIRGLSHREAVRSVLDEEGNHTASLLQ